MNPTNQQPAPTDPYLNLLLQIRDSVLEIRDSVRGIEQCMAVVEDHLGINPQQPLPQQQQQQQQPLSQSLGAVAMPPAAYRDEEQQEQLYRNNMAFHYQPPPGAPDLASTGIIERYRNKIERFESNIKYMYKFPINKCKDHWVANYFIHNVFKSIVRYITNDSAGSSVGARSAMSRMGLSSQRGASLTPTLQMQGSFMPITSDHTESHTQDQIPPPPPPISPSIPSPLPSLSTM
ncbi:hypothetical protein INT45_013840 [Circinella minor]|uniref:Uncharacterized protein n=1 Tax=Circinella minor TaxID=1195481 RepID=A0A8H7UZX2_9FUNG|nr:hypothetical protein INT45_013840 [Circinella minor]